MIRATRHIWGKVRCIARLEISSVVHTTVLNVGIILVFGFMVRFLLLIVSFLLLETTLLLLNSTFILDLAVSIVLAGRRPRNVLATGGGWRHIITWLAHVAWLR
jgi:hypothetical protein